MFPSENEQIPKWYKNQNGNKKYKKYWTPPQSSIMLMCLKAANLSIDNLQKWKIQEELFSTK